MIKKDKYDEINKHYFTEIKYTSWLDWHRLNKMQAIDSFYSDFFDRVNPALLTGYFLIFIGSVSSSLVVWWSSIISILPLSLILYELVYNGWLLKPNKDWLKLNASYYLQLKEGEKRKYYSKWYLDAIKYDEYTPSYTQVKRPNNRKHWKNNIPENRILSWKEFKKYNKNKAKQQRLLAEADCIQEFKEYYDLEVKQINEIER